MISRISVKVGRRGKGVPHFSYVMGIGKYADKDTEILHRQSGNMPSWAKSPCDFWSSADELERANGSAYREHILSLPRELTLQQNIDCVQSWIDAQLSDKHAYSYAIHAPNARDGGTNYHAHIMFSDRMNDGIERTREQYFKRTNKKEPARGGAVKANSGMTWKAKKEKLKAVRHDWGEHLKGHLREHGFHDTAERVDMRNWKERGLSEPPKNLSMQEIQMAKKMDDALSNHPYFIDLSKPPAPPAPAPKPAPPAPKPAHIVHHTPPPAPPPPAPKPPQPPSNDGLDSKHSIQPSNNAQATEILRLPASFFYSNNLRDGIKIMAEIGHYGRYARGSESLGHVGIHEFDSRSLLRTTFDYDATNQKIVSINGLDAYLRERIPHDAQKRANVENAMITGLQQRAKFLQENDLNAYEQHIKSTLKTHFNVEQSAATTTTAERTAHQRNNDRDFDR